MLIGLLIAGCAATQNQGEETPEVKAAVHAAAKERRQAEMHWQQAQRAFAQAAAVDKFMMQNAGSSQDSKHWAFVAHTHQIWAEDTPEEFTEHFQDSCVLSAVDAFDKAGSQMIGFGKNIALSADPSHRALSFGLIKYGGDLANLKIICQQVQARLQAAKADEAAAESNQIVMASQSQDDHPYARLAGQIIGTALVIGLVGGAMYLNYEAARSANASVSANSIATSSAYCQQVRQRIEGNIASAVGSGAPGLENQQLSAYGCH